MTRASRTAKRPPLLAELTADPAGVVLRLLETTPSPFTAAAVKRGWRESGVDTAAVDAAWRRAQPKVRLHPDVVFVDNTYRWRHAAEPVSPGPTGEHSLKARLAAAEARVSELERALDQALSPGTPQEEYERAERRRHARERWARIEAMTRVAEIAGEVEELVGKQASAEVLVKNVRTVVALANLEPIGAGGERVSFDSESHDVVGEQPSPGSSVVVIRPGYRWNAPGEVVLLNRAQVRKA